MRMSNVANAGFTLVELVVTLIIIGALAAVGAPIFFRTADFSERGFYDETVAAVRYAQKYAMASGCTIRVELVANGYRLWRNNSVANCNSLPYNVALINPANGQGFQNNAPTGVTINPAADFNFLPSGSPTASTTININGRSFSVVAATGFIQK